MPNSSILATLILKCSLSSVQLLDAFCGDFTQHKKRRRKDAADSLVYWTYSTPSSSTEGYNYSFSSVVTEFIAVAGAILQRKW